MQISIVGLYNEMQQGTQGLFCTSDEPVRLRVAESLSFMYFLNVGFAFLLFIPEHLMIVLIIFELIMKLE